MVIGGQDASKVKPKVLFRKMFAVMQKFQKYKLALSENIYLSNAYTYEETGKKERLEDALTETGIDKIDRGLPNGYDTEL